MRQLEIVQKIFAFGATYQVFESGSDIAVKTVKGKVFAFTPNLVMVEGDDGARSGSLTGNFFRTEFTIRDVSGTETASVTFPFLSFKKRFTLSVGARTYTAAGGFTGLTFTVNDERGELAFSVDKELFAIRDRFSLRVADTFDVDTAVLAIVAVDQKYFQQKN